MMRSQSYVKFIKLSGQFNNMFLDVWYTTIISDYIQSNSTLTLISYRSEFTAIIVFFFVWPYVAGMVSTLKCENALRKIVESSQPFAFNVHV